MYEWWNLFFTDMEVFFWTCAAVPILTFLFGLGFMMSASGIAQTYELINLRQVNRELKLRITQLQGGKNG